MKRYIYIVALKEMTSPDLKFRHAFIDAEDDAHAYDTGFGAINVSPTEVRQNDYVVALSEGPAKKTMSRAAWRLRARAIANICSEEGKIQAIKAMRLETGCGLRDALHAVERLERVDWSKV